MASERRAYASTVVLWLVAVLTHFGWHVIPFAVGTVPLVPKGEVYFANDVGFQVIVFAFAFLPFWCAGLLIVILAEFAVYRLFGRRGDSGENANASAP